MVSDLALFVSPVWLLVLLWGCIYTLAIVGLLGLGSRRLFSLLGVGVAGVLAGQIASDLAGLRLALLGDFHLIETGLVALILLFIFRVTAKRQPVRR